MNPQMNNAMKYRLEIDIPGLPPTTNGSHGSIHAAAAKRKKWRNAVARIAFYRRPPEPLTAVRITVIRFSSGKTDFDNRVISAKPLIDGLKDARVIVDDSDEVIRERNYPMAKIDKGKGFVRIIVEEL